jgi:hypothetical protein
MSRHGFFLGGYKEFGSLLFTDCTTANNRRTSGLPVLCSQAGDPIWDRGRSLDRGLKNPSKLKWRVHPMVPGGGEREPLKKEIPKDVSILQISGNPPLWRRSSLYVHHLSPQ